MRLITTSILMLAFSATSALSGGGTVTSTEPGPTTLTEASTAQMLETMAIVPAAATTTATRAVVTYAAPPPALAKAADAAVEEAEAEPEVEVAEVATGPLDPRETISQCTTCHGVDGIAKIPTAPNIAGSSRQYLETQLKAFRSGKRENEVMSVIAEDMTNAEIKAAAKWYASLKVTVEVPE